MTDFDIIIDKLERFIKKFYFFKMLKGLLFILAVAVLFVLLFSFVEYFNYLAVNFKTNIFYFTLVLFFFLFISFFIFPLLSFLKLRKRLNYPEAASFVSKYFPDVKDSLLNVLELNNLRNSENVHSDLLLASINQRSAELSPFPFSKAINYDFLRTRFFFFGGALIFLFFILLFTPKILTEGTGRLLDYSHHYEPASPFSFILLNSNLHCEKGKVITVQVKIDGEYLPSEVFVEIGTNRFLMDKGKESGLFRFDFRNVNNEIDFNFYADKFRSQSFKIKVLPTPIFKSFSIDVVPPSYTGIERSKILNAGDIRVPYGTKLSWNFTTSNVDSVSIKLNTDSVNLSSENNQFSYNKRVLANTEYSVSFSNKYFKKQAALKNIIDVIPDNFPEISLTQVEDSLTVGAYYYMISIKDDYGFKDLKFVCNKVSSNKTEKLINKKVNLNNSSVQNVFHYYNFNELKSDDKDAYFEYYFVVRDNDYVSGFKSAKTSSIIFKPLTRDTVASLSDKYENDINSSLNESKKLSQEIRDEIENFKKRELNEKVSDWDKRQFLKSIQSKQKQLQQLIDDSANKNQKKNSLNNQYYKERQKLLEKQKKLQELMNQVMDDELKKLLEEINEMSQKLDNKKFENLKEKINLSYDDIDKKLDRNLELLKRYQVEENVSKIAEDLKKLSEKQEDLSEKQNSQTKQEELTNEQKELSEKFKKLNENFEETKTKNSELKSPYKFDDLEQKFDNIDEQMDNLKDDMSKNSSQNNNNNQKNQQQQKEKQKKISKDMQQLSEDMQNMMSAMNGMELDINIEELRQIIDNLTVFSFSQEDNYEALKTNYKTSPKFLDVVRQQKKLESDFAVIKDSVEELSTKLPMMSTLLTKEVTKLSYDLKSATSELEERHGRQVLTAQRQIITSANTLSLYLDELMNQMKNQQNQSGSSGSKSKQMSKQSMMNLKKQQQKLKGELQKLLEQMRKDGNKPGGKAYNKQVVKTLAEQEIFNKMLEDMQNGKSISPGTSQQLKEIKKLSDQNVEDLINKNIGSHLLNRNKQIKTRLLQAENADRKQDEDKKRESKEGNNDSIILPPALKESLEKSIKFKEGIKRNNLKFNKYYDDLTRDYFMQITD